MTQSPPQWRARDTLQLNESLLVAQSSQGNADLSQDAALAAQPLQ